VIKITRYFVEDARKTSKFHEICLIFCYLVIFILFKRGEAMIKSAILDYYLGNIKYFKILRGPQVKMNGKGIRKKITKNSLIHYIIIFGYK